MFNLNRFITVVLVLVGSLTAMAYNVGTGKFYQHLSRMELQ
jgi:hypothetical protein